VINCFQLYPPSLVADGRVELWFHLDQTLLQLFDTYGVRQSIGKRIAAQALAREREGYERAVGVVMHSHWAAESVIRDYGIDPGKVSVVVPGANLDPVAYAGWASARVPGSAAAMAKRPLRLVFVGKHPERKGLDRLLRALALARAEGAHCTLRIIGCTPDDLAPELRDTQGVEWVGFIDKRRDAEGYLNAVAACDIGCLLSRAEAGGIGLREYHALGLAVIGPDVGGSADHVIPEAARLVGPQASDEEIAAVILELDRDRTAVQRMREVSWARRREVTWEASVAKLAEVMGKTA
jgi:glycosyltransferase involved in cell wall biosynthesis